MLRLGEQVGECGHPRDARGAPCGLERRDVLGEGRRHEGRGVASAVLVVFIVLKVRARKALEKSLAEKARAEAARKQKEEHESIDLTLPEG